MQPSELAELITKTLDENKAKDIIALNVRDLTSVTDYMVICTAGSTRQAKALCDKVLRICREHHLRPLNSLDESASEWQLLDYNDVIVHIMLPDTREFYQLEKLWDKTQAIRRETE
ncbi:MAG: ribosome silencing factor [Gammaproteobacteria bacterium RIFCSPHIGHO2_12_FULL_41_15]|nr:MAG: ribosome silencing factor [Gammaproteobacteria bacterium RIFCSPHIGHO2_12_FULL_41_15]